MYTCAHINIDLTMPYDVDVLSKEHALQLAVVGVGLTAWAAHTAVGAILRWRERRSRAAYIGYVQVETRSTSPTVREREIWRSELSAQEHDNDTHWGPLWVRQKREGSR